MEVVDDANRLAQVDVAGVKRTINSGGAYPLPLVEGDGLALDARETVLAVTRDSDPALVSARFHNAVAAATAAACVRIAGERALDTVVLSGGVFQNRLLLERTLSALERDGLRVLVPRLLPPNDGGISYGQAAVAAALMAAGALPSRA